MRYPKLVPEKLCKTDIVLEFEQEGLNVYGEPLRQLPGKGNAITRTRQERFTPQKRS